MTDSIQLEKLEQLQQEENFDRLELTLKSPDFFHPLYFHVAVEKFTQNENLEKSLFYASFGADFIKQDDGRYFGSIHSNSIGTMLSFPLIKWKINTTDQVSTYRILACAYFYLTAGINLSGIKAYDSLRTRGLILNKYSRLFSELATKYVSPDFSIKRITELIICDKYFTSIAFKNIDSNEEQKAMETTYKLTQWYKDNHDNTADLMTIVERGKSLHQVFHNGLISRMATGQLLFERSRYETLIN